MFRLTKQERQLVAFLAAVLLLGTAVRAWRSRQPADAPAPTALAGSRAR